jgi:hypothetical protein
MLNAFRSNPPLIFTTVKFLEVELSTCGFARPKAEIVCGSRIEPGDWYVICHSFHDLTTLPDNFLLSVLVLVFPDVAVELDLGEVSPSRSLELRRQYASLAVEVLTSTIISCLGNSQGLKSSQ